RDLPLLIPFSPDFYGWFYQIDIHNGEMCQLRDPDACLQEHLQNAIVSGIPPCQGEHFGIFIRAEVLPRMFLPLRGINPCGWRSLNDPSPFQEPEVFPDR